MMWYNTPTPYNGSYGPLIGMGFFGGMMMLLFWVILIAVIVWAVRQMRGRDRWHMRPHAPALDILRERYARGEIDKEEFEAKKRDLEA